MLLTDHVINEIIEAVINSNEYCESENESDKDQERKISHAAGKDALEIARRYVEQQPTSTPVDVPNLKKWRNYAADRRQSNIKQKKMTDFFS